MPSFVLPSFVSALTSISQSGGEAENEQLSAGDRVVQLNKTPEVEVFYVQPADIGCNTGNGKKLSNSQSCCLAQLCLAAA